MARFLVLFPLALLLVSPALAQWVRVINGRIPTNVTPFSVGNEANGTPLYLARASHAGGLHIGKVRANSPDAFIPYGGQEIGVRDYEVYVGNGIWRDVGPGQVIPATAIQGGHEADNTPLYMARARIEGGVHPGKVRQNEALFPYGGQERSVSPFQVLVSFAGGNGLVTLYPDCAYGGTSFTFRPGRYNVNQLRIPNDALSSLRISDGYRINMYEDPDFSGRMCSINQATSCLTNQGFNDLMSSFELIEETGFNPNNLRCNTYFIYRDWANYLRERPLRQATGNALEITAVVEESGVPTVQVERCYFSFIDKTTYPCVAILQSTASFRSANPFSPTKQPFKIIIDMVNNTIKTISPGESRPETFYQNCILNGESVIGVSGSKRIVLTINKTQVTG